MLGNINATPFLHRIECVLLGHPDNPQNRPSDVAVMAFAIHCPALKHIELSSCPLLSEKSIICLVQCCPLLHRVFLEDCVNFGDPALEAISRCGNLQELTLKGKLVFTPQGLGVIRLTGMALQCLMDCKSLKYLTLDHFKSSGQGLAEVGLCGLDLKCFSLRSGWGIRDVELQMLVQGSLFEFKLHITDTNLNLMTIADRVKTLKWLSLVKCESISDMGIVAQFSALEPLNLDQFRGAKTLEELNKQFCMTLMTWHWCLMASTSSSRLYGCFCSSAYYPSTLGYRPSAGTQGSATQDPYIAASDSSSDFDVIEGYPMQQHSESSSQDMHALGQQPGSSMFSYLKETFSRATRFEHVTNEINKGDGEVDLPFTSQIDLVLSESAHMSTPATTPIGPLKLSPFETLFPYGRSLAEVQEVECYILAGREKEVESLCKAK
ncbi:hypothetical protein L7F22_057289 [Adiantum nelumboides]|nr:hypothetical protein [Adiantum nelumboides]